jgi:hypothetical protein
MLHELNIHTSPATDTCEKIEELLETQCLTADEALDIMSSIQSMLWLFNESCSRVKGCHYWEPPPGNMNIKEQHVL